MKKNNIKPSFIILYTITVVLLTIACNYNKEIKEPEFFMIERSSSKNGFFERFVIANPPKDTTELKLLVEQYNINTIPIDTFKKYKIINRSFYRETDLLTRDYKRFEPYPNEDKFGWYERIYYKDQDLVRHHDDLIMQTMYDRLKDNSILYSYCFNYEDYLLNMQEIVIDIDTLYLEGVRF
jgi:hypothetical protein